MSSLDRFCSSWAFPVAAILVSVALVVSGAVALLATGTAALLWIFGG